MSGRRSRPSVTLRFDVIAVIALGGMLGATARFELARVLPVHAGRYPWATFWTNLSGSFVLGLLLVLLIERFPPTRYLRAFLATGVIGAYTTMSTFAVEVVVLVKDGHVGTGIAYMISSVFAGVGLSYLGVRIGRLTPRRQHMEAR